MVLGKWIVASAAVVLSASMWVSGEDAAPAVPATQPTETHMHMKKLIEPWGSLKDLTPDQTEQITKIHSDALAEEKKIHEKETADITALLTPEQVTELKDAEAKMKGHRAKRAKPTTEPA